MNCKYTEIRKLLRLKSITKDRFDEASELTLEAYKGGEITMEQAIKILAQMPKSFARLHAISRERARRHLYFGDKLNDETELH